MNQPSKKSSDIVIYADGAAAPNPGKGGYGVVLLSGQLRRELSGGFRLTTNNRMELLAVIEGLKALKKPGHKVTVYSDSRYVVEMLNGGHVEKWQSNGWALKKGKKPVLNPDLWDELLKLTKQHTVKFVLVEGHGSNRENNRCDELAVAARQKQNLPADDGYENPKPLEVDGNLDWLK